MPKVKMPALFLLLSFFIADSVLLGTNRSATAIIINTYLPLALCFVVLMIGISRLTLDSRLLFFTVILVVAQALSSVVNSGISTIFSVMAKTVTIILCYLICNCFDFDSYIDKFEKCVFVVAVFSLIVYVLCFVAFDFISLFPVISNSSGFPFYNLGLSVVPQNFLSSNYRNYGLFREPGVYQMYLAIALYIQLFIKTRPQIFRTIIYVAAVVTTLSTTGFVAILFLLAAFLFQRVRTETGESPKHLKIKVVITIMILALAVFIYFDIFDISTRVFNKLLSDNSEQLDIARKASIVSNLIIWLNNPLFGAGEAALPSLFIGTTLSHFGRYAVDNTNTLLFMFACYGFAFGALFMAGTIGFSSRIGRSRYGRYIFFILIVLLYIGQNLKSSLLPYTFVMYGMQHLLMHTHQTRTISRYQKTRYKNESTLGL